MQVVSADRLTEVTKEPVVIVSCVTEVSAGNETDVVGVLLDTLNAPVVVSAGKLITTTLIPVTVNPAVTVVNELKLMLVKAANVVIVNPEPTDIKAGKLIVVREAIVAGLKLNPTLVNEGADKVVNAVMPTGLKAPPTDSSSGRPIVVKAAIVLGEKLPPIFTKAGNE